MHQLEMMKERLMNCVQGQIGDLYSADSKELGEAIDMIKDLSEAIYYCSIVEAMKETKDKEKYGEREVHHYYEPMNYNNRMYYPTSYNADTMFYPYMYYSENGRGMDGARSSRGESRNYDGNGTRNYTETPVHMRDYREGRSGEYRRMYMESKEMHKDKAVKMQELEKYMHELSNDMTEMITEASPEEKQMMKNKLTTLAGKIV